MGMIKTNEELRLLKKAAAISNSCINVIEDSLREDITERELARRVRRNINKQGATLSFQTLVGSGKRSSMVHTLPHTTDQKIQGIGYIDFGAKYKGYASDVTVPFVKGQIGKKEERIIKTGLAAYSLAVKSVRIGEPCWKLHQKTDKFLRSKGFVIPHGLGHGLGKKVHERPIIGMPRKRLTGKKLEKWRRIQKITFQPNTVFTIEPGIYVKNFGGFRIENDFLLTKRGMKVLTKSRFLKI
jgi:Xaa-Pro aminopeptidase